MAIAFLLAMYAASFRRRLLASHGSECYQRKRWINTHHPRRYVTQLSSWVASASGVWTQFATSSRRLPTGAFTPSTRRNSIYCWQICSDSWRLSPTSCKFRTHRRRDSTRQLSRVGVGGVFLGVSESLAARSIQRLKCKCNLSNVLFMPILLHQTAAFQHSVLQCSIRSFKRCQLAIGNAMFFFLSCCLKTKW